MQGGFDHRRVPEGEISCALASWPSQHCRIQQVDTGTLALDPRPRWMIGAIPRLQRGPGICEVLVAVAPLVTAVAESNHKTRRVHERQEPTKLALKGSDLPIAAVGKVPKQSAARRPYTPRHRAPPVWPSPWPS